MQTDRQASMHAAGGCKQTARDTNRDTKRHRQTEAGQTGTNWTDMKNRRIGQTVQTGRSDKKKVDSTVYRKYSTVQYTTVQTDRQKNRDIKLERQTDGQKDLQTDRQTS
jgi:hypothetical protein